MLAGVGCASAPPPTPAVVAPAAPKAVAPPLPDLTFRPGEPPRRSLALSVVFAAPAATAATLDALSRRLALPVPLGQELLGALGRGPLGGFVLPRGALARLDAARPVTIVHLAKGIGVEAGTCAAATFKDAAAARRTLDELGQETGRQGGESARRLPSGLALWAGVHGRTLLLASEPRTLAVAGGLAEELQDHPAAGAVRVTLHPGPLVPLDAEPLGRLLEGRVLASPGARRAPLSLPLLAALARAAAGPIAESRTATFTLEVSDQTGLSLGVELEPEATSSFARALERRFPYVLDPAVALSPSAGALAWGGWPDFVASFGDVLGASGPRGRELRAAAEAFLARVQGPWSCSLEPTATPLGWRCAWRLRAGAKPADVLRRRAALEKASAAWTNEVLGTHVPLPTTRIKGDVLELEQRAPPSASPGWDALFGGSSRASVAAVRGGSLVVAHGGDPRAVLATSAGAPPSPGLAAALERTHGANFLLYFDPLALLMRLAAAADDPKVRQGLRMMRAIPGFEALRFPVVASGRSGATGRYELELPLESLENVARLIVPFMGVMGGPPPP